MFITYSVFALTAITTTQSNTGANKTQENTTNATGTTTPQRVQIMRTPDGRLTVKGLMPGQQLIQTSDGKLQVVTTTQIQQQSKTTTQTTPLKTAIIKTTNATTTPGKIEYFVFWCPACCLGNGEVLLLF